MWNRFSLLVLCVVVTVTVMTPSNGEEQQALTFFVSLTGNDNWSGKISSPNDKKTDGPFASLERVREEIRKIKKSGSLPNGGVIVEICGGVYERSTVFELTAEDSGTEKSPVVYRAKKGEEVRLVGGKTVTGFKPIADETILTKLDKDARGKVLQADLKALGIADFGEVAVRGKRFELFFQDKPMTISRWPNKGFVKIVDIVEKDGHQIHGIPGSKTGKFIYDGDRPKRWTDEKDVWLHGYWFWDWSEQRQQIKSIDSEKHLIELTPPYHGYGYRKGQWFYAFNLLCEIDQPGEWYLDRASGILYFWPPAPINEGKTVVSLLPNLVSMKNIEYVTFQGMILEASRGTAVAVSDSTGVRIAGCTIRNGGAWAVQISGGKNNGVIGCDIYEMGGGGVSLTGGDRNTLTAAGLFADNNHIHHYSRWDRVYQPGISLNGVGNRAEHNLIDNAPHMAIGFSGNDHLIEFNEIHSVCYESNDAGAIYAGRNWTMRGTIIRHNYFHDISGFENRGCVGVYLDDMFCGTEVSGNVFYRVTSAAFIGGGRDCKIENNIFVDCKPAVHVDARALGWAAGHTNNWIKEAKEKGTLSGMQYDKSPYKDRYPELPKILEDNPAAPKGNVIARNISWGGTWDSIEGRARPLIKFENNLLNVDPLFVDAKNLNFQLQKNSPAYKLGFKKIPIEKIGPYKDELRPVWPIIHQVRPAK